ncbi:peptide-binding protein [Methylosinus sp. Sm6]|uniref:peptide-binding protein n=1 Tax=Methylosinus sp. Sm6 TaxID=2866948 RepID=UPI001C992FFF|nr:peptide-binding protein [Methylosinus sp. Sm6]MBY6241358.1 peptide-binding protein [Methylosinus sp. Sm6]
MIRPFIATGLACALSACSIIAGVADMEGQATADGVAASTPMILDGDQILFEIEAETPDGAWRRCLALLNMGQAPPVLRRGLYDELEIAGGRALRLRIGGRRIEIAAAAVRSEPERAAGERQFGPFFPSRRVDMVLQSGALSNGGIVLDYPARRLVFAASGALPADGVAAPIRVDRRTGLALVDAQIDGATHAFVIDAGSPYSWTRGALASSWAARHPEWLRAKGAVGPANYNMLDLPFEKDGLMLRIPQIMIGPLAMRDIGVMGSGPSLSPVVDSIFGEAFWDIWQANAGEPVAGWLGANVLKTYRLTIDYPRAMSYWRKMSEPDPRELDVVGVTLVYESGRYFIGGVARKSGLASVAEASIGDEIVAVDGMAMRGAPREAALSALHGAPGERKLLRIARKGLERDIEARVDHY